MIKYRSPNLYKHARRAFGAGVMPIRPLLQDVSFSPEDVTALTTAFEDTLSALGLVDRNDPAVLLVAKYIIIELAKHGERTPARGRETTSSIGFRLGRVYD
jgi:hypothetical protein